MLLAATTGAVVVAAAGAGAVNLALLALAAAAEADAAALLTRPWSEESRLSNTVVVVFFDDVKYEAQVRLPDAEHTNIIVQFDKR